jgi:hypothetical protein
MSDGTFRSPRQPWVTPGQIEHLVSDLTAVISADCTLAAVQEKLWQNDQWLPIDGPVDATIESLISINSTGPLRLGFGAWRDLLLGVQFVNGKGELITAGGVPIKNVAGYDLGKLMVGQSDRFGKILAVTTRAYRKATQALVARLAPEREIIAKMIPTAARPAWAMMDQRELLVGYLGDATELEFYRKSVAAYDPKEISVMDLGKEMRLRQERWRVRGPWGNWPWMFRASVPPARIEDFISAISSEDWVADPAFGIVLGGADERVVNAIRGAAVAMGGSVVFRSIADGGLVAVTMNESEKLILEKLKKAFDPENKLAALPRGN